MACVEWFFDLAAWTVWVLVIGVPLVSAASGWYPEGVVAGALVLVVGLACWSLVMLDMATYRPRLFAACAGAPEAFFSELGRLDLSLKDRVLTITQSRPRTLKRAKEQEQFLFQEANAFLLLDAIRGRITRKVLHRLVAVIGSLGLMGYGLSLISDHGLIAKASEGTLRAEVPGLPEHVFFALSAFYGYGDIFASHGAVGYAFIAIVAASFVAVIYFVLTDIIASQGEFRFNLRVAAESYVLQNSRL